MESQSPNTELEYIRVSNQNLNRGFYMSAHVLLDLLNELRKRDKCEAC